MIITYAAVERHGHVDVWQEGGPGGGLEDVEGSESRFESAEVSVGPVCCREVGGDAGGGGAEEVEEEEEGYLGEGRAVVVEF